MSEIINCLKRARIRDALHEPRARLMEDLIPGLIIVEGKYIATTNPCSREGKEFNRVYPFYEYVEQGYLTTTRCRVCSNVSFRPRVICPECLSEDLEWIDLPTAGTVEFVTEEEFVIPPGFETPLIHGLINLRGVLKIFSRIVHCQVVQLKEEDEVKLSVFPTEPVPI